MLTILSSLAFSCAALQGTPLYRGTYRGPYEEVLIEQAAVAEVEQPGVVLDGYERWEFWFEHQREALLLGPVADEPDALLPDGRYGFHSWSLRRGKVLDQALPVLLEAMKSSHPEIREAAALSLGRVGDPSAFPALEEATSDPYAQVRQAAYLGLGLLADNRSVVTLSEHFSHSGRPVEDRAFAVVGLGLTRRPEAARLLQAALARHMRPDHLYGEDETLLVAEIWAAGLLRSPAMVPLLIHGYQELERKAKVASRRVRGFILYALGAIGDPSARPFLGRALDAKELQLQRAAAQALGRLGDPGSIGILARYLEDHRDPQSRIFCLLAAGRLGGRSAAVLLERENEPSRMHRQVHAAWGLAVGLASAGNLVEDVYWSFRSGDRESPLLSSAEDSPARRDEERLRGGLALGLGFYGDRRMVEELAAVAARPGVDPDFAGYLAMALGRMGGDEALASLHRLERRIHQADGRRGLAWGFGLVGTEPAGEAVLEMLLEEGDATVRLAAARALGLVRSQDALDAILAALEESRGETADTVVQSHFVLALGFLADPYRGDRLAATLDGLNYRVSSRLVRSLASY